MRVPVPIAIAACIIATGAMWYFNTRNQNFTTPPSPETQEHTATQWKNSNIQTPSCSPISTDLKNKKATPAPKPPKRPQAPPRPKTLPLGDLDQSPRLSEYGTLGTHGTAAIIQLAHELEKKGAQQRALLAWERVLDTTEPSEDEVQLASQAIKRLSAQLLPWNPDPTSDLTITLHAGATLKESKLLEEALQTTADVISEASGFILKVKTKTSIGKGKPLETPRIPIALWFTRSGTKAGSATAETPPLSFLADPSLEGMLTSQCQAAVYALMRSHLTKATSYSNLPEYPAGVKPDELLKHHVTRLMWREFANSLK
jgi:hypothetical protein